MIRVLFLMVISVISINAHAIVLNGLSTNSTSVGYTYISIDTGTMLTAFSITNWDPELWIGVDDGNLSDDDWFVNNDDGLEFAGDAIINTFVSAGDYIVAIGPFNFIESEATSGNAGNRTYSYGLNLSVAEGNLSLRNGPNQTVPEPSAIALMGLGLLGFAATRRKIQK